MPRRTLPSRSEAIHCQNGSRSKLSVLVHHQPVVGIGNVEFDQAGLAPPIKPWGGETPQACHLPGSGERRSSARSGRADPASKEIYLQSPGLVSPLTEGPLNQFTKRSTPPVLQATPRFSEVIHHGKAAYLELNIELHRASSYLQCPV